MDDAFDVLPGFQRHDKNISSRLISVLLSADLPPRLRRTKPKTKRQTSTLVARNYRKPMRAVLIKDGKGPVENLYIGETSTPEVKATEVLVKV